MLAFLGERIFKELKHLGVAQPGSASPLEGEKLQVQTLWSRLLMGNPTRKEMKREIDTKELSEIVKRSFSKSDVMRELDLPINGSGGRIVKKLVEEHKLDTSHFDPWERQRRATQKYPTVEKTCPVCSTSFLTKQGSPKEKTTCSHACSNSYFRSGKDHPNYNQDKKSWGYRRICFSHHKKECILCGFSAVVDVHHIDEDRNNNSPENLVPLCPNHHRMIHTKKYGPQTKKALQEALFSNRA